MIKPEHIPDEAIIAVASKLFVEPFSPREIQIATAACAAMLAAWPGAWHVDAVDFEPKLILPLTQENNNGSD